MIAEQGAAAPVDVWVGLGANLGEREEALRSALQRMAEWPGTRLIAVSALYASAPVDAGGPDYLNAVAHLQTTLAPLDVLQRLQAPETKTRFGALLAEPVPTTPQQFESFMASERAKYKDVVKLSGAKVD